MESIINYAEVINKIDNNDYFKKLKSKPTRESFLKSQESFIDAVDYWSKILAKLVFKVPSHNERLVIIENMYDEHGKGDINQSHVNTFNIFLKSMGAKNDTALYQKTGTSDVINKFIKELDSILDNESWVFCAAVLGMIEYTYITVSRNIHNYCKNFMESDKITHYSVHEILDVKHATDLFSIFVNKNYDCDNKDVKNGIKKGYDIFDCLYRGLSKHLELN